MNMVAATTPDGAESRPSPFPTPPQMTAELWSIKARFSSVPMPDHEALAQLQAVYPQAAEIIFGQMVAQSNHRMEMEKEVARTNNTLALRGQIIAGLVAVFGLPGCFIVIAQGYPVAGTTIGTSLVLALAYLFVLGKDSKQKELVAKAEARDKIAKGQPPEVIEDSRGDLTKSGRPKAPAKGNNQGKK